MASGQFCLVVSIKVKGVQDVGIVGQIFLSLLKEDKDISGVFDAGCYRPGAACIPSA